jgi:carbon storage regulator
MLVLTRKSGESIVIDNQIEIRIVQIKGGRVRLAVDAPHHVRIVRHELVDHETGDAEMRTGTWQRENLVM